jgi:hypothetical protein
LKTRLRTRLVEEAVAVELVELAVVELAVVVVGPTHFKAAA